MLLLVLALPMAVLAGVIALRLGRPVLFRQTRPGKHERPFEIVKFRSMTDARDAEGNLLADDERLPAFGHWLRASSLDELPELWNVLKGDMSLVGPRPLLMEYLGRYSERQAKRHDVRPGITGWAQVNGRNRTTWPERLELDVWYVENRNFWLDLRILWLTVWRVLRRDGISFEGSATMPLFRGNESHPSRPSDERA